MNKKVKHGTLLTVIFTVLSLLYLYPIVLVFINSFKKKAYISKAPFEIPTGKMYVGLENYIRGIGTVFIFQFLKILTEMGQIIILNIIRDLFHDFRIFCRVCFLLFLLLSVKK